jgi:maltooligosyltrehalose trehalohydrolase
VNNIFEPGDVPLLHDLSLAVGDLAAATGRHIHLVLENGDNIASLLDPTQEPPRGKYRGQWNDDYHHAWHVLLTGEAKGYYGDYQRSPRRDIARALGSGFVYQGEAAAFWGGKRRGEPSGFLPPSAFVNFLQNHDQIGNRALGDRLENIADPKAIEAALAVTLLAPNIPMLFMGEEWGSKAPFPFFCDFHGDLADAVRKGRRQEYDWAYAKYGNEVPDPLDLSTFKSAVLDWEARNEAAGKRRLALVQRLLAIRQREIVPRLAGATFGEAHAADNCLLTAHWRMGDGTRLRLLANLSNSEIAHQQSETAGIQIWGDEISDRLPPWSVYWHLDAG